MSFGKKGLAPIVGVVVPTKPNGIHNERSRLMEVSVVTREEPLLETCGEVWVQIVLCLSYQRVELLFNPLRFKLYLW